MQWRTPHERLNPRLNRASEAAAEALATKQGRKLPKAEFKAAVDAALQLTPVVEPTAPTLPAQTTDVESLQANWIPEHSRRPRQGSGRPLSKTAIAGLWATNARLAQYQPAVRCSTWRVWT